MSWRNCAFVQSLFGAVVLLAACNHSSVEAQFESLRADWVEQSRAIAFSSRSADYVALPAFRAIVALGPAVVPVIENHLTRTGCEQDFFLAYAITEVQSLDPRALAQGAGSNEQAFCRAVLEHLSRSPPRNAT